MPSMDQDTKRKRMELVLRLIERHPNGLTEQEIAEALNIGRRTVNNYLRDLEIEGKLYKVGLQWSVLPYRRTRLRHFELSAEEAMTLCLATRLLVKQHDKRNESAETALVKLAEVLTGDAGVGHEIHQAALELAQRPGDDSYSRIFRIVMQSYIYRRKVAITYHPLRGDPFQTVLSPYLLEPSAIGYATYVIGHSSIVNDLRTYKLQRILEATLISEEYIVPAEFPGLDYLQSAWSIISGDDLIAVKLRFSPRVTRRVRESRWHPLQDDPIDDPDIPGGCIWTACIADLTDFVPWVRSWGADVEVLEPEVLREALVKEARRLALVYQLGTVAPPPRHQLLWAKTDRKTGQTHPLICHMIDVAQVALAMWRDVLTEGIRAQFAEALGLENEPAGRLLAFWAGLHDLGKASPTFQDNSRLPAHLRQSIRERLTSTGLPFTTRVGEVLCYHGAITTRTLLPLLVRETNLDENWAYNVSTALGGHHGDWPTDLERYASTEDRGIGPWDDVRYDLFLELKAIFDPPFVAPLSVSVESENALSVLFSGLTSVADWLGSMEAYFVPASDDVDVDEYVEVAAQRAERALKETGWLGWRPPTAPIAFEALCDVEKPRPLQQAIIDLAPRLDKPVLVIIEAPTGVGKTEAALYLADHWTHTLRQRGAYVAMPTMATSNQMFSRMREALTNRYPDEIVNYHLLHGDALLREEDELPRLAKIGDDVQSGTVAALEWFTKRKRGLLAPFAVGTVDQALMSILQTRHFFVRLFGLSHKSIIFDEVHAYDTYMEELFFLLLRWLRAIGASVVVLSATLPEATRRKLVEAYTGIEQIVLPATGYPAVTWTMGEQPHVVNLEPPDERHVFLERITREPEIIAQRLKEELVDGGCAAVICNTVKRAQQVYKVIRNEEIVSEDDLILFHARFPATWRRGIENRVLDLFGKPKEHDEDNRPHRAIVIATQVIEQSLDLDFDLMVSDLAPVDLIIQRIGRLHRHDRGRRPPPCLLLAMPDVQGDVPRFDRGDVWVYGHYLLLRSYVILRERDCITVPTDVRSLIESVYDPESQLPLLSETYQEELDEALEKMEADQRRASREAYRKLIPEPDDQELLERSNARLEEDDPELHIYQQAATRLAPPSITLICLHRTARGLALDSESGSPTVDVEQGLDQDTTRALFGRKITVMDHRLVRYFAGQLVPDAWRKNPWLRYARLVEFDEGGVYRPKNEPWILKLDRRIGLVVGDIE